MSDSKIQLEMTVRNGQQPKLSFGLEGDLAEASVSGKGINLTSNNPNPAESVWSIDVDWNDGSGSAVTYASTDLSTTSTSSGLTKIVAANWTIESKGANTMNRLTLLKPAAYTGLSGNVKKTITVEGGFGTAGSRKLCFPKTIIRRYDDNRHLNPFYRTNNKHTVVTLDYEGACFKFKNDPVGIKSADGNIYLTSTKIKGAWTSTYVLKLASGLSFSASDQTGISFDTSGQTVTIVVTEDFGTVDATISNNAGTETVTFEHNEMSASGLNHPKLFSRMTTSIHKVQSASMLGGKHGTSNLGGQPWNNKIETLTIFNENFKIHGYADFFGYYRLKSINKDGGFTSPISPSSNKLEYTFLGCINLKLASNVISTMDTSGVEKMVGVFCGCTKMRHIIDLSDWNVANVKDASYLFEFSSFNGNLTTGTIGNGKWFFRKCVNFTGMFKDSSFNKNINSWAKGLRRGSAANYTDMFKDAPSFSKAVTGWSDKISGATGLATMFSGATNLSSAKKPATVTAAENAGPAAPSGGSGGSSSGNQGLTGESDVTPVDSESFTIDGNQHEGNEEGSTTWLKRPTISWLYDGVDGFTISIVDSSNTEVDSESTAFYQEYYQLTTDLSAGSYTAKVKAVDSSGNSSASTDFSFEVSDSAPTETPVITKGTPMWVSGSNKTADFSPVFVLSGANSQYDDIYALSFDGGTTYPTTYEQNASDIRPIFSTLGQHTIKVKLKRGDNLGSKTATITFNIVYDADTIGVYNGGSEQDISNLTPGTYTWTPGHGQLNCITGSGRYMETNSSWGRIAVESSTAQNISVDGAKLQFNMGSTPIFQFNAHANSSVATPHAIIPLNSKISIDSIERNETCLNPDSNGNPYSPGGKLTKIVLTISA